jgi:hypothetical protein
MGSIQYFRCTKQKGKKSNAHQHGRMCAAATAVAETNERSNVVECKNPGGEWLGLGAGGLVVEDVFPGGAVAGGPVAVMDTFMPWPQCEGDPQTK